ncbi:hypothetical protein C8R44DRAFT_739953 [Mycena epipterygia]|nr:hypothetical protein C8R44DRAFT_739953 [Mycena epipterygia]
MCGPMINKQAKWPAMKFFNFTSAVYLLAKETAIYISLPNLKSSQPFYNQIGVSPHVPIKDMVFYYLSMNYNKYQGGSKGVKDQEESYLKAAHDGPEVWVLAEARQRLALTDVSDKVG